jgi:hypothetical protein
MGTHTKHRRWSAHAPGTLAAVVVVSVITSFAAVGATTVATGGAQSSGRPAAAHKAVAHRCFGLFPGRGAGDHYIEYPAGCSGHDEPDLAAISSGANTASNIKWTIVLPTDGTGTLGRPVVDLGPTFWFGATVRDSKSIYGQAFQELQFYPDSTLTSPACGSDGSFSTISTPNKYTVCSPVWAVKPSTFEEYAAFNGMLKRSGTTQPLVMNAGDTVTVQYSKGTQTGTPFNIVVTDVTTGQHSATLVLSGGVDGPLAPLTGANTTSNYMRWGAVQQAPLSLAWEIGHPNQYQYPLAPACFPGMFNCYSYNVTSGWQHTMPLKVRSVRFNNDTLLPSSWTVVDGQGGSQQDIAFCGTYNAPGSNGSCTFPWYSYRASAAALEFGGTYPNVTNSYNTYNQFRKTPTCSGPFGPNTIFCPTTLSPKPSIP